MKKNKLSFFIIVLIFFLLLPIISLAQPIQLNLDYPKIGGFDLNNNQELNEVIAWIYYFVITISGIAVFAMLVWGGFTWLTSTGEPSKIADAKDRIYSAFLGLLIILASFLIMQTINPELVALQLPGLPTAYCPSDYSCSYVPAGPCPEDEIVLPDPPGGRCCCDFCDASCNYVPAGPCPEDEIVLPDPPGGRCCCPW